MAEAYNTCIAPQAATAAAAVLLCYRLSGHTAYRRRLSPHPQTFTCDQTAICSCGLPFNGLYPVINVTTWIITHLLTPEGWKAGLGWLVDP